jgi:hypothetical protein
MSITSPTPTQPLQSAAQKPLLQYLELDITFTVRTIYLHKPLHPYLEALTPS